MHFFVTHVVVPYMPHHSAPRLGSVCPNEGIAPWAAAKGHPWPSAAIPASMPGCPLHNACVRPSWLTGRRNQRPPRGGLIADLILTVIPRSNCGSELAREGGLPADLFLAVVLRSNCGSELAREGGQPADLFLAVVLRSNCGSELAREDGLPADLFLPAVPRSPLCKAH